MTSPKQVAYGSLLTATEQVSNIIIRAKSSQHPLELDAAVVAKLIEAQQALFEAQRLIERKPKAEARP